MEAGSFEPAADAGLCQGIHELFDALYKDVFDLLYAPLDFGPGPAVVK